MSRTEIVKLRVTPAEKERLAKRAGERGISEYVRAELGLDDLGAQARTATIKPRKQTFWCDDCSRILHNAPRCPGNPKHSVRKL